MDFLSKTAEMAQTHVVDAFVPVTPMKNNHHARPDSKMHDSPFSDYFSNDGGDTSHEDPYYAPSPETQRLLVRLSRLQAQLMRGDENRSERDTIHVVGKKLDEIELQLNTMHSQTRMPPELEDSGLFMEEEESEEVESTNTPNGNHSSLLQSVVSAAAALPITAEKLQGEHGTAILNAQAALENVTRLESELRQHQLEAKERIAEFNLQTEDFEQQTSLLKSENEALKTDLGFDQTELLFLKLQHESLGVEVQTIHEGARRLVTYAPNISDDIYAMERKRIRAEMRRWDNEWQEVNQRFAARRARYGLPDLDAAGPVEQANQADASSDETGEWQLETVEEGNGKIRSITIKRTESQREHFVVNDSDEEGEEEEEELAESEETELDEEDDGESPLPESEQISETPMVDEETQTSSEQEAPSYADQGTQTDQDVLASWLFKSRTKDAERFAELDDEIDDAAEDIGDDCAITTTMSSDSADDHAVLSSSEEEDDVSREVRQPAARSNVKVAWQDLWKGLADLAGMGDERF